VLTFPLWRGGERAGSEPRSSYRTFIGPSPARQIVVGGRPDVLRSLGSESIVVHEEDALIMILRTRLARRAIVPALALGLAAAGWAGVASAATGQKGQPKLGAATLNGSGSTLTVAFLQAVIAQFKAAQPSVTVNYGAGGSGKGRTDFANGVVQFAGTDAPYAAGAAPSKPFDYIPTIVSPVTVSYNLAGVKSLQLSPDTIAGLFSGTIKTWNDPAVKADNPKVNLPSTTVTIARRSDSSGTTQNFTAYLQLASPTKWTLGSGATVNWPASSVGGNGSTAVATNVKNTDGAVGYIDFSDAKAAGLKFASIKNAAGQFVAPSVKSATQALVGVKQNPDETYNPLNTKNKAGYPITSPTYLLVSSTQSDPGVGNAVKAFLTYIEDNSTKLAPAVDYAPIPSAFQKNALSAIAKIQVG
jgi:phosphate transport system substrate-binding protein